MAKDKVEAITPVEPETKVIPEVIESEVEPIETVVIPEVKTEGKPVEVVLPTIKDGDPIPEGPYITVY